MAQLIPGANEFKRPETIGDFQRILSESVESPTILSGGTSLAFSQPKTTQIVDVSGLPYTGCKTDSQGNLNIGAMTTIGDLEADTAAATFCGGILRQATDKLASTPLRNLITVGGNLAAGYAWSDLPVALLAVDAAVAVFPRDSVTPLPVDGQTSFRRLAGTDELITNVILNGNYTNGHGAFIKVCRTSTDLALVTVAVAMNLNQGAMKDVRVVVGGMVPTALRLADVEAALEGQVPGAELFEKAAALANVTPRPDTRASAEYRLEVMKNMIVRACATAIKE